MRRRVAREEEGRMGDGRLEVEMGRVVADAP